MRRVMTISTTSAIPRCGTACGIFLIVFLACCAPANLSACLWDHDTLRQERSRFPSTLELITGKFLRHSQEFYQWRINDRLERLKADPDNPEYLDDLAVAYEKTSQHDRAVEVMEGKEQKKPGIYETYSNLGTFYILAGDFEQGLPFIDKALAINPDAHFGREKYQKWLVEYALSHRQNGKITFPLRLKSVKDPSKESPTFRAFLRNKLNTKQLSPYDVLAAVKGVLGMMRFADHTNPLLLEALGDLLLNDHEPSGDAKQLAARCYLKASYSLKKQDPDAEKWYREYAQQALSMQLKGVVGRQELTLEELEAQFQNELAQAEKWYATLRERELGWIQQDKNVEHEFDRLYSSEPTVRSFNTVGALQTGSLVTLIVALCAFRIARWRAKRHAAIPLTDAETSSSI